jgi:hypothetical protein
LDEPTSDDKKLFRELREVLADYALSDSRSLRWRVRRRLFDRRSTLTPATVRLTEECIRVRLAVRPQSRRPIGQLAAHSEGARQTRQQH